MQPVQQELPVGQLRERVVERQVLDLLLGRLALGDVAADRHPVRELARLVPHRRDFQVDPEGFAAFLVVDQVDAHRLPLLQRRADVVEFGRWVSGPCSRRGVRPITSSRRVAGAPLESFVDEHDARPRAH